MTITSKVVDDRGSDLLVAVQRNLEIRSIPEVWIHLAIEHALH